MDLSIFYNKTMIVSFIIKTILLIKGCLFSNKTQRFAALRCGEIRVHDYINSSNANQIYKLVQIITKPSHIAKVLLAGGFLILFWYFCVFFLLDIY